MMIATGLAQAQDSKVVTPHQHRPASIRHARDNGTADSTNWSGYAVAGANDSVTYVAGSWEVPSATCSKGSSAEYASFWVGIDGWNSPSVEQIGTDSDCSNGTPSYYAWFEFYPEPSYYAGSLTNLTPGDIISASVSYSISTASFTAKITDVTTHVSYGATFTPNYRTGTPLRSSAEWIAEAPSAQVRRKLQTLPLADFGVINLGGDPGYTGTPDTCYATVNGVVGPIGSFGANVWSTTMINDTTDAPMATPSRLTPDGSSFSITWDSVGP